MRLLRDLDRYWYASVPAERLAVLRIAVGLYGVLYLLIRAASLTSVVRFPPTEFEPIGVVRMLEQPLVAPLVYGGWAVALLAGCAFVAGVGYRISGPLFAAAFLWVTTYRSAWGMIFHSENLAALHLALLAWSPAADALSVDARRRPAATQASGRYGWVVRAMCAITVVSYVLAGVAKLRLAGPVWLDGELLRGQVAYDNLRKIELGSVYSPVGAWLVRQGELPFRLLAWLSLLLELGAPAALLSRPLARGWVAGVFGFHLGVGALMAIAFPYQLSFVAYLSFFPAERLAQRVRGFFHRGR
jgi:hypothetical protein